VSVWLFRRKLTVAGKVPEVPRGDAFALHSGLGLGQRQRRGLSQALAQLAEVAPHGELALGLVHDADVHEQMRRRRLAKLDVAIDALARRA
jgi:hypothetical protein